MDGDLGDFLRSRRARIQPEDVGLPSYGRRRVPGLRREEVAQLAGVSVDYYIRLEQGRGPGGTSRTKSGGVSDAVLDSIARVLRLDKTEHAYLLSVARPPKKDGRRRSAPRVRPGVQRLLDGMERTPAFVLGPAMDALAWNTLGDTVHGFGRMPPGRRNLVRQFFLESQGRDLYADRAVVAAQSVANLRLSAGAHPDDHRVRDLIGELSLKSEEFRRLWADHQVKACLYGVKRLRHPVAGLLTLPYESLTLPETPEQTLVVYTPEPGSETAERLALLGSWATAH
ncbi:helix-turn-helix transcriptional regulator [Streptomyces coacervatus]|uniref:Helix-turn-helix transcriptional regulator n=1 Tax=Streptomyces coacervatus TaxID=647381 RepID=A0ABP7I2I6_9ACTN|nr:helix-turn-helix transcriptional regulator [Streptomyces coacervatus]MDF2266992.1 helix-turn-helix transcriptional regulator [Streptomyces coacervatus]